MSTFANHLSVRCRAVATAPFGWMLVVGLALFGTPLFLGLHVISRMSGVLGGMLAVFGLPIFSLLFGFMVVGEATWSGPGRRRGILRALPALPIGPRARAVAEALAGYALVLPLIAAGLLLSLLWAPGAPSVGRTVLGSVIIGLVLTFPSLK